MQNDTHSQMLVFNMDQLYPKQVDQATYDTDSEQRGQLMISSGNYLERGFYFLSFDTKQNTIQLTEYTGYSLKIRPKSINDSSIGGKTWHIVMEVYGDILIMEEQLNISLILRSFTDPSLIYSPTNEIRVDSSYLDLNLTKMAIGPLQRYYFRSISPNQQQQQQQQQGKNYKFFFINYESKINIQEHQQIEYRHKNGSLVTEDMKAMSINNEGKASIPYLTIFYKSVLQACYILQSNLT